MSLNTLYLFSNVKITRDYAVVHDMTASEWFDYLTNKNSVQTGDPSPPVTVLNGMSVNYYRLPDVIRIEGNYDELRKATYGTLKTGQATGIPSFSLLHFWVDSVHLVKQGAFYPGLTPSQDVVELEITLDTWSNKFTDCDLYDSYIERRHVNRWWRDHSDPDDPDEWVYHPNYYPNAADGVGGSYEPEGDPQDLTEVLAFPGQTVTYDLRFIVVNIIDSNGEQMIVVGANAVGSDGIEYRVYSDNPRKKIFSLAEIMDGSLFTLIGQTASFVQSITVTPYIEAIKGSIGLETSDNPPWLYINDSYLPFAAGFAIADTGAENTTYITVNTGLTQLRNGLYSYHTGTVDPKLPEWVYIPNNPLAEGYSDKNEPMMYRSPARIRRVTSGMGGTIVEVPDVDAFRETYTCQNLFEMDQAIVVVFGGGLIEKANAIGNIGTVTGASLPIYSSAWKEYQAIQKAGDDIAFNAQQVSTVIGTFTGAGAGMAGGAIAGASGGPAGAVAGAAVGVVGGIVGGVTRYWSNSENLRAKRETIQNSPCNVKSGGSGLGAYIKDYIDIHYQPLKLDRMSLEKLRTQYYYFGYNISMVQPGVISTATRKFFDYIETRGARIRGDVNADEAQQIAAAFDRGVRIYHGADGYKQIGAGMSLENPEREFLED